MDCPRCSKSRSYIIKFYFSKEKVYLKANVCEVCDFIYAEDEALLKAARSHLRNLTKWDESLNK